MKLLFLSFALLLCASRHAEARTRVLILGDSLTEGYGLSKEVAYPALVEKRLKALGKDVEVINGGVSGSTTASGKSRLQWHLKNKPDFMVLALGANDGLRGLELKSSEKNLTESIKMAKACGLKVALMGMKVPPNMGPAYARDFESMFAKVAKAEEVPLLPFLLEGVGGVPKLNLSDGIHPNAKGHEIMADTVTKFLQKHL